MTWTALDSPAPAGRTEGSRSPASVGVTEAAALVLEARAEPRVAADLRAEIYCADPPGWLPAQVRDMSIGGVCIATRTVLIFKAIRRIALWLPRGRLDLEVRGRWQSTTMGDESVLTGLSFENPSEAHADLLSQYIGSLARELAAFILECPDLSDLARDDALSLAQASKFRSVQSGVPIYKQDSEGPGFDSIFLIRRGYVSLTRRLRDAHDVQLVKLGPGSMFGGIPLVADTPNTETAVAAGATVLVEITRPSFEYLTLSRPLMARRVAHTAARAYVERVRALLEARLS